MGRIVTGRAVVGGAVVVVLEGAAVTVHVQGIIAKPVGHRLALRVIDRVFQSIRQTLAQRCPQRVVVHHGARFRNQQRIGADRDTRIDGVDPQVCERRDRNMIDYFFPVIVYVISWQCKLFF